MHRSVPIGSAGAHVGAFLAEVEHSDAAVPLQPQRLDGDALQWSPVRPGLPARPQLHLTNLLNEFGTLGDLAVDRLSCGDVLNAYLLAAGMEQVAADYLQKDSFWLRRAAARFERRSDAAGIRVAAKVLRKTAAALHATRRLASGYRAACSWHVNFRILVDALADELVGTACWETRRMLPELQRRFAALVAQSAALPGELRRSVVRLPTCFRSLDQAPADLGVLSRRLDALWGSRGTPLVVLGVRTSGDYLAPLQAAFLRSFGWHDVRARTWRPGAPWLPADAAELRALAQRSGLVAVVDDPPRSWSTIVQASKELIRFGFPKASIVILVQVLPGAEEPPPELDGHPIVRLPWNQSVVRRRLRPAAVRTVLSRLLGSEIADIQTVQAAVGARAHASALFEVATTDQARLRVRVRGTGCGYFGEHALGVGERLRDWVPQIYGLRAGLIYEAADAIPLSEPLDAPAWTAIARYAADRATALPAAQDVARHLSYRGSAWRWAGNELGGVFGWAEEVGRLLAAAVARRVLEVRKPSVVDAHTEPSHFLRGLGGRIIKADYDTGVFTSTDLYSFDPEFDVARAAVAASDGSAADLLRRGFEVASGTHVSPDRWLLHQLVHAREMDGELLPEAGLAGIRLPRAFQRYYGEIIAGDLEAASSGRLCGIDVDGVLETMALGFPATSPAGMLALRALTLHGFRPVLATGRSLPEVMERCDAYRLSGGVAEYGAAVWASGEATVLNSAGEGEALERVRATLQSLEGVELDARHQHSVRAFRLVRGRRLALPVDLARALVRRAGLRSELRIVNSCKQTDFVARRINKAGGLAVLADLLGAGRGLALAIGDTESDSGMLRQAGMPCVPAGADAALVATGARVLSNSGPAAVAEAATSLLGHQPGGCPTCAPNPKPDSQLLDLLRLQDRQGWRKAVAVLRLARAA